MGANYQEGLKRLGQVIGGFWLGLIIINVVLIALIFLIVNISVVMIQSGVIPWPKIAAVFAILLAFGGIGYIIITRFTNAVQWIIKGFNS